MTWSAEKITASLIFIEMMAVIISHYRQGGNSPLDGLDVGFESTPSLVDLDGDGG